MVESEEPSLLGEEEEGGGPVKPFLEHLEDLRWTIIKSLAAIIVCMVVCLIGSDYILKILEKPLYNAAKIQLGDEHVITLDVGPKSVTFKQPTNSIWSVFAGTN